MTINREALRSVLRAAFPDPVITITEGVIDTVVSAMAREWRPEWEALFGVDPRGPEPLPDSASGADDDPAFDFFLAHARHTRRSGKGMHSFVGYLPMVGLTLPLRGEEDLPTPAGRVYAGDHKLRSLAHAQEYLQQAEGFFGADKVDVGAITRIDLVTPPRELGARFGAIATYVCFVGEQPRHYILEAGMATGEARTLYFAPDFAAPIVRRTWYVPTPFSSAHNYYRGLLQVDPAGRPTTLGVDVLAKPHDAVGVLSINVKYERLTRPVHVYPGILTVQAACRVAAIAQERGELPMGPLTPVLAAIGRELHWTQEPTS